MTSTAITVETPVATTSKTEDNVPKVEEKVEEPTLSSVEIQVVKEAIPKAFNPTETKVSAFSLSSIKAKKELEAQQKSIVKDTIYLPTEVFNETDMLLQWNKFAQKLEDKGQMILHSLMMMNDPKLEGTTIIHELPNEGTKIEFERIQNELLGYLRGMLHNHDVAIEITVNESMESKRAFTPQDKFNRLNQINPHLEELRKAFDLDI
ncbi:MAG: DNA polymerase III subunit gamma/tau [Flavobacterium sp.]|nr:DNA polymerase III subunit gamma/tau [Flavobacterium sp.]